MYYLFNVQFISASSAFNLSMLNAQWSMLKLLDTKLMQKFEWTDNLSVYFKGI